jgi:hypothetical protein
MTSCEVRADARFRSDRKGLPKIAVIAGMVVVALAAPSLCLAERTRLKPGLNVFSTQQDIEIGKEVSKEAEQQLVMLNDEKVDDYLGRLGSRLAAKAPGAKYPYQFRAVNDPSINAFALPGGLLYVNRGTIEAADNEAQLAGVIGHEIGHAALRHGTNQMTKATLMKLPLTMLGGAIGSDSLVGMIAQAGASFGEQSILLKYSRDAERQADLVGTQILYDNNYDPRQMAQFFVKLEEEAKKSGGRPIQFFSSHPNPENRVTAVNSEVTRMGGHAGSYQDDTAEFREIQRHVRLLPPAPKALPKPSSGSGTGNGTSRRPALPSSSLQDYANHNLSLRYPDNWKSYGQGDAFTLAPDGGFAADAKGNTSLAYGVMMAIFEARPNSAGRMDLESATAQLINNLHNANPDIRISKDSSRTRIAGQPALATTLTNLSPMGANETDYVITVLRPEGLVYFVLVAPEQEFNGYQRAFQDITNSIRFAAR